MVRECFRLLELDSKNYGTSKWNPLRELINPGDKVVLKPNFVRNYHEEGKDIYSVITHPSIIRAMIDYVYIALKGKGEIIITDAPLGGTSFGNILNKTKLNKIVRLYKDNFGFNIPIIDLRKTRYVYKKNHFLPQSYKLKGDPLGYVKINLGKESEFAELNLHKGAGFISPGPNGAGVVSEGMGEYLISKTVLSADVIISLPKLKVHKKAGVTLNLKNMLGISGTKNWLPHFRVGSTLEGGDEVSDDDLKDKKKFRQYLKRKIFELLLNTENTPIKGYTTEFVRSVGACPRKNSSVGLNARKFPRKVLLKDILKEGTDEQLPAGDWFGNDTIWRTILDLNEIVTYADKNGNIQSYPQRKFFSLIDGIIAGEKEGPLNPSPKGCGVLISGFDFLAVDLAAIKLMGFDYKKIPQYKSNKRFSRIKLVPEDVPYFSFSPPKGWEEHIRSLHKIKC